MRGKLYIKYPHKGLSDEAVLYFNNLLLYNVVQLNYMTFLKKSNSSYNGDTVSDGRWKKLSEKTIKYKKKKRLMSGGKPLINIRTRALVNSLRPGWFRNGVYVPRGNQIARVTKSSITFASTIPYSDRVDDVRPIYVHNMEQLVSKALREVMPKFARYLELQYKQQRPKASVKVTTNV